MVLNGHCCTGALGLANKVVQEITDFDPYER